MIQRKISLPKIVPEKITFGKPIWEKCECGEWREIKTKKHVKLKTQTLNEFLSDQRKCIDSSEES